MGTGHCGQEGAERNLGKPKFPKRQQNRHNSLYVPVMFHYVMDFMICTMSMWILDNGQLPGYMYIAYTLLLLPVQLL
jgi:hypothetical protein